MDGGQRSARGEARAGVRLVREVEAFLSGSSEDWFFTRGQNIPAWAYINKVAHADPDRLGQLAAWAPDEPSRCHGWREAVAILARDTIEAGDRDPRAIRRVQLDSLVGLELHLITRADRVAPRTLVALGRACLSDDPEWDPSS
jgi:hypothetical protein